MPPGTVPLLLTLVAIVLAVAALLHLFTHQRDCRSAAFWAALVIFAPFSGPLLYAVLGINFVRRRGKKYRARVGPAYEEPAPECPLFFREDPLMAAQDCGLAVTLDRISRFHFTSGNEVRAFVNGDEAMPAMLEAIRHAQSSIALSSFIFEAKGIGQDFVEELAAAHQRGVQVRVIVDDAGTRYSWPPITRALARCGVPVRRFMPNHLFVRLLTLNLRNHKKLLIVDGSVGFTGGMNIREGNMLSRKPGHPVQDVHFQILGPVVAQMQRVFAEDWQFCAGESLEGSTWFPDLFSAGDLHALGIVDGPDEDFEVMPTALFAALNAAQKSVHILTPYFLPPPILIAALKLCTARGVEVSIITPGKNNIALVSWAGQTLYPDLLHAGCRIYESPPPFDHSKLFLVDDRWCFLGSTNWDPRSLRLNFEFNLACHGESLASQMTTLFNEKLMTSQEVTEAKMNALSQAQRIRNGIARLFIPVL